MFRYITAALLSAIFGFILVGCSSTDGLFGAKNKEEIPAKNIMSEGQYLRSDDGRGGVQVTTIWLSPEFVRATGLEQTVKDYDVETWCLKFP